MPIISIENEQKLKKSFEKFEKRFFSYLVRQEKKKKNASPYFRIGKETLSSITNDYVVNFSFVSDEDFKKYKIIEKINSIGTKDFEKNKMCLAELLATWNLIDSKLGEDVFF